MSVRMYVRMNTHTQYVHHSYLRIVYTGHGYTPTRCILIKNKCIFNADKMTFDKYFIKFSFATEYNYFDCRKNSEQSDTHTQYGKRYRRNNYVFTAIVTITFYRIF